jgi:hypothetical protein
LGFIIKEIFKVKQKEQKQYEVIPKQKSTKLYYTTIKKVFASQANKDEIKWMEERILNVP